MKIQRIAVFCGSSGRVNEAYPSAARDLGRALAARGLDLVYGGARVGMMGELARAALAAGARVTGVMPRFLVEREVAMRELADLRVVETMHERKALMADLADAFIALPGGIGTLEEFFEIWTFSYLGLQPKPVGALNTRGYYDPLLAFLEQAVTEEFVRRRALDQLIIERDPGPLLDRVTQS